MAQGEACPGDLIAVRQLRIYNEDMSTVQDIEAAIAKLKPEEIEAVARWLQEYQEQLWDRQIEEDAKAGRLDGLIAEAKAEYRAGKATPFP